MSKANLHQLEERVERLAAQLVDQRRRVERVQQGLARKQGTDVRRVGELVQSHARQVDGLKSDLVRLRASLRRQALSTKRLGSLLPRQLGNRMMLLDRFDRIAAGTRPILVGPWTGEVGYEVLYWIPFVRWFVEQYHIDPARLHVVSRGGPISWYQGIMSRYVDTLSFLSPDEFRSRAGALAWMKQDKVSALDRQILRRARGMIGGARAALLHPLLMFRTFKGFWGGRVALNDVLAYTSHCRLAPPLSLAGLPRRYVAVRFYFRTSFPDTDANRALVARTLSALTSQTDVVVLNPGFQADDHCDYVAERGHRLHTIDHLVTPDRNLEVQTAAIAGADAFVGSYGGFSYLAPLLGVNSVAFYSERTFKTCHLELAESVFDRVGGGSLTIVDAADVGLLSRVLPSVVDSTR